MAKRVGSTWVIAAAAVVLLPFASCGSDSTLPVVVVTPQPVRAHLTNPPAGIPDFPNDTWVALPIPLSVRGTLEITVDWTFPDSWIYLYFGQTRCELPELVRQTCPFSITSETQAPKPRRVVTGLLDAGTYYLYLYNVPKRRGSEIGSDHGESVQIDIWLTIPVSGARVPVQIGPASLYSPQR